jgi:hypothetical protein
MPTYRALRVRLAAAPRFRCSPTVLLRPHDFLEMPNHDDQYDCDQGEVVRELRQAVHQAPWLET